MAKLDGETRTVEETDLRVGNIFRMTSSGGVSDAFSDCVAVSVDAEEVEMARPYCRAVGDGGYSPGMERFRVRRPDLLERGHFATVLDSRGAPRRFLG